MATGTSNLFSLSDPGETMRRGAVISECTKYRYILIRSWGVGPGVVNFVILNPSTADASIDDPTIRRCVGFAKSWGFAHLVVTNLYAFRSTDPKRLKSASDAIGPDNNLFIRQVAAEADCIVCAWGNNASDDRSRAVLDIIRAAGKSPMALKITGKGSPSHPLYLPADSRPIPFVTTKGLSHAKASG